MSKALTFLVIGTFLTAYTGMFIVSAQTDIIAKYSTNIPTINGSVAPGEWDDATEYTITLASITDSVRFKHDGTNLYTLLKVQDSTTSNFVDPSTPRDWAGIDFDRNNDGSTMGSETSPDDVEFANYYVNGGEDWWLGGINGPRNSDTNTGGVNNVMAAYGGSVSGYTYWEFKKTLNSGDTNGYDIALNPDSTGYGLNSIKIMFAYENDGTGRHATCSGWYTLALEPSTPSPGWIEGTVIDASTSAAIVGATVTANGYSDTTDAVGYYKIASLPAGTYTVTASATGYESSLTSATVLSGQGTTVNFALTSAPSAPIYRVDLVRRSAWKKVGDFSVILYAIVKNVGTVGTYGKVKFTLTSSMGTETVETAPIWLDPGQMYGHESEARYTTTWAAPGFGVYNVSAESWSDSDGDLATGDWTDSLDGPKTFTIRI